MCRETQPNILPPYFMLVFIQCNIDSACCFDDISVLTGSLKTITISVRVGFTLVARFEGIVSAILRLAEATEPRDTKLKQSMKINIINRLIFLFAIEAPA